jgi:flavin-dependent dehydrogenase
MSTDMPSAETTGGWGKAWRRDQLDAVLLERATQAGVKVFQPFSAMTLRRVGSSYVCRIVSKQRRTEDELSARIVLAAHGSWEPGGLPTQLRPQPPRASDLLAFKARFRNSKLDRGMMPLVAFSGGYGGMVHGADDEVGLSCCIRRDQLHRCRAASRPMAAGEAVLNHIRNCCDPVREVLESASLASPWLAAGPIRPGIRLSAWEGIFLIGNAAGEAHPVIAEGISMAMQSAWLLTQQLLANPDSLSSQRTLRQVQRQFELDWKRSFARRLRTSALVAHWAMRPNAVTWTSPLLRWLPSILTFGARLSGKDAGLPIATGVPRPAGRQQ